MATIEIDGKKIEPKKVVATIEINGKIIEVAGNKTIIEVADEAGVYIPRFCYHKKLSVAANCRMCLVEISGSRKTVPACATPIAAGMKIFTQSAATLHSQKAVMEFLLINHPLDCPICDQGGQCELQDLAMGFGQDRTQYNHEKHSVDDPYLGPLVATSMTRCIHCTRCVRFTEEVAGLQELGGIGRGEEVTITNYIEKALTSELSGNIVEICPVGALLAKPSLYEARAWELHEYPTIAAHDCVGSHLFLHTRRGKVIRAVPQEHEAINEVWISDRDRFSYSGIHAADRLKKPQIKIKGIWQETDWTTALRFAVEGLEKVLHEDGSTKVGALASPSSTLEELYLLKKLMNGCEVNNLDYRLRQTDFADDLHLPKALGLPISFEELEQQNAILLVGSYIRHEQPLLGLRVRKASLKGANIMAINMIDHEFNFALSEKIISAPINFVASLQCLLKVLLGNQEVPDHIARLVEHIIVPEEWRITVNAMAAKLLAAEKSIILLGAFSQQHPQSAKIRILAAAIAELSSSRIGFLTEGANSYGAGLVEFLPQVAGANVIQMLEHPLSAYVLLGIEPELDISNSAQALKALKQAKFNVSLTAYDTVAIRDYAHVMLPITTFAETAGTFVNAEGKWQSFKAVIPPYEDARPAWKVCRVLGNFFEFAGFDFQTSEQVKDELVASIRLDKLSWNFTELLVSGVHIFAKDKTYVSPDVLYRITSIPMYSTDAVVRRSSALQEVFPLEAARVHMHPKTGITYGFQHESLIVLKQVGGKHKSFNVCFDDRIPEQCILVNGGTSAALGLGEAFGAVEVAHNE